MSRSKFVKVIAMYCCIIVCWWMFNVLYVLLFYGFKRCCFLRQHDAWKFPSLSSNFKSLNNNRKDKTKNQFWTIDNSGFNQKYIKNLNESEVYNCLVVFETHLKATRMKRSFVGLDVTCQLECQSFNQRCCRVCSEMCLELLLSNSTLNFNTVSVQLIYFYSLFICSRPISLSSILNEVDSNS